MHFKKLKIQRFKSISYFSKNSFNVKAQVPLARSMSPLAGLGLRHTGPRPSTCKATSSIHETCMHYVSIRIIYIESSCKEFSYIVQQEGKSSCNYFLTLWALTVSLLEHADCAFA